MQPRSGLLQPQLLQKRTHPKKAFRALGRRSRRRSLQGPWHGPSGTQPSSAIVSASPAIALVTRAPIYLHLCNRTGARQPRCACAMPGDLQLIFFNEILQPAHSVACTECAPGELLIATVFLRGLNLQVSAARSASSRAIAEVKVNGRARGERDGGRCGLDGWARLSATWAMP